jgi:hypothetical protein
MQLLCTIPFSSPRLFIRAFGLAAQEAGYRVLTSTAQTRKNGGAEAPPFLHTALLAV